MQRSRRPYRVRRAVLQRLLDGIGPPLALVPVTTDGAAARARLIEHLDGGIEGVVAKRLDQPCLLRSEWREVRVRASAETVVGGVLAVASPVVQVPGLDGVREHGGGATAGVGDRVRVAAGPAIEGQAASSARDPGQLPGAAGPDPVAAASSGTAMSRA